MLDKTFAEKINQEYEWYISLFNKRKQEITEIAEDLQPDVQLYFKKAVTQIIAADIISIDLHELSKHVKHIYNIVNTMEYCKVIPLDIIFDYILPYRINDESFELYSPSIFSSIKEQIDSKSITNTALKINYWCFENAVYHQADDRTQNAMTTIKSGFGRCGEESVLLVSALRSAGIPARQSYSPYWLHCDDNHAWVEVYTGTKWQFMGACEPEEKLNIGWFNNAASRAGVVRHRVFGLNTRSTHADGNYIFTTNTTTGMYCPTRKINVSVLYAGRPEAYARVGMYTINYCKPSLLLELETKQDGTAEFEAGYGDVFFFVFINGKGYDIKIAPANQNKIMLNISNKPGKIDFNLTPSEGVLIAEEYKCSAQHLQKLEELQINRHIKHNTDEINSSGYYRLAQLNYDVIKSFLNNQDVDMSSKQHILNTLTQKDFTDVTLDILEDMLSSYKYKEKFPNDIFYSYLLPLRVENEQLYAQRSYIEDFCQKNNLLKPSDIYNYLSDNCSFMDNYNYPGVVADIKATLKYNITTEHGFDINAVQMLRAIGIAARLNPIDQLPEYYDNGTFVKLYGTGNKSCHIDIQLPENSYLKYGTDFTICRLDDGYFKKLSYDEATTEFTAESGLYAITQSTRQIDGSSIGNIQFAEITKDNIVISLNEPIYTTKEKLKLVDIPKVICSVKGKAIVAFVENGSEPTEHFINELLEYEKIINTKDIQIIIYVVNNIDNLTNSLKQVQRRSIADVMPGQLDESFSDLRMRMHIGDLRLPFITAVQDNKGLYSFANYNVGTVKMLIDILEGI